MKKVITLIVTALLVIPAFSFLAPQTMLKLRQSAMPQKYRGETQQTFQTIGKGLAGTDDGGEVHPVAYCLSSSADEDFPQRKLVALCLVGFKFPSMPVASKAAAEQAPSEVMPNIAETAAVSAYDSAAEADPAAEFLARQAVFADHSIPASVDCGCSKLPFEHVHPVSATITSVFGYRVHPVYGDVRFHYGTDFDVLDGDDIYSFASGTVSTAGELGGYGKALVIDHGSGYTTLYGHCSELLVSVGESVTAGQLVAHSGHSGLVTGPHMHFELRHNDKYLNPEFYI